MNAKAAATRRKLREIREGVGAAFEVIEATAASAGNTITESEAESLIQGQLEWIRELRRMHAALVLGKVKP